MAKRCSLHYFMIDCGGVLRQSWGNITSPGYPAKYGDNVTCNWMIKVSLLRIHTSQITYCSHYWQNGIVCGEPLSRLRWPMEESENRVSTVDYHFPTLWLDISWPSFWRHILTLCIIMQKQRHKRHHFWKFSFCSWWIIFDIVYPIYGNSYSWNNLFFTFVSRVLVPVIFYRFLWFSIIFCNANWLLIDWYFYFYICTLSQGRPGRNITLVFHKFVLEHDDGSKGPYVCPYDSLEVRIYGPTLPGPKYVYIII